MLSEVEQAAWDAAEAGGSTALLKDAQPVRERAANDAIRLRLFQILAHQTAGDHRGAFAAAGALPIPESRALDVWRRAERVYAGRKRREKTLGADDDLKPADAEEMEKAGGAFNQLVAARSWLALGLSAIQDNRGEVAETHLERAGRLFGAIGSLPGRAVTETELGKLRAWQGRNDESVLHLVTALSSWRGHSAVRSADVWHEIGALMLDSRRYPQAVEILESVQKSDPSTRTLNALTRALIAAGDLEPALVKARDVYKTEHDARQAARAANQAAPNPYREVMALRDLGEIAVRRAISVQKGAVDPAEPGRTAPAPAQALVQEAEDALREGAKLLGFDRTDQTPVFPKWVRKVDSGPQANLAGVTEEDPQEFEKLRLVQLELMIDSYAKPEGAGRNLSKLAEAFSRRGEVFHELEVREQAAAAFRLADNNGSALRQLELAHRLAMARAQTNIAHDIRRQLSEAVAAGPRHALAAPGCIPMGVMAVEPFRTLISALDQDNGRRVIIHRYRIPRSDSNAIKKAEAGLKALEDLRKQRRVLVGLPEILAAVAGKEEQGQYGFDLVTEDVSGEPLAAAMQAEPGDPIRPVRVIRSLAAAIQGLHNIHITDIRPDVSRVLLDLGDAPVWTELLPVYEGKLQPPENDVKMLAGLLVEWLRGGPGARSRLLYKGGKNGGLLKPTVFAPGKLSDKIPPGLETLLSGVLLDKGGPKSPGAFADELEKYAEPMSAVARRVAER